MKYLTYLISLLFVLAFFGCDKTKKDPADVKETTTETFEEAVEEATEAVEKVGDKAKEIVE